MTDEQVAIDIVEIKGRCTSNEKDIVEIKLELKEQKDKDKMLWELISSIKLMSQDISGINKKVEETNEKISEVKEGQKELSINIHEKIGEVEGRICDVDKKVDNKFTYLENMPNKKLANTWDKIKTVAITALITGGIAFLYSLLSAPK